MVKPLLLEGGRGAGAGGDDFFTLFETGVTMANERIETTPVPRPPRSLGAPYPIEAETLHARFLGDFSPSICFDQIFFLGAYPMEELLYAEMRSLSPSLPAWKPVTR